jgi:inorganic pyrophosphatase
LPAAPVSSALFSKAVRCEAHSRLKPADASDHGFVDRIGQPSTDTLMSLDRVPAGRNVPDDFNVIIEIPAHADPIKYEVDKETGAVFVDRFIGTAMHYPCNYGYVPKSLADDGDPLDVLVITPFPLQPGVVVRCRPLGVLKMEDEAGGDSKLLAVPVDKILPWYKHWQQWSDIAPERLAQIQHFFEHYKDLEQGKWVKVIGWEGPDSARKDILDAIAAYKSASPQPAY